MSGGRGDGRSIKEQTVVVDVGDNRTVKAKDVIASIEHEIGEGCVVACVPKSGNVYEVTLVDKGALDSICDTGFRVTDIKYKPSAIFSRERVVSFFNVSHYVPDSEIRSKLESFGAELVSPIRRKTHEGTNIANGTRYVMVRFPPDKHSLPYTIKLPTGVNSFEYIRVVHDNQTKVCSKCFESNHVYANCPDNICYKCKQTGHLARSCNTPPCNRCNKTLAYCRCQPVWEATRTAASTGWPQTRDVGKQEDSGHNDDDDVEQDDDEDKTEHGNTDDEDSTMEEDEYEDTNNTENDDNMGDLEKENCNLSKKDDVIPTDTNTDDNLDLNEQTGEMTKTLKVVDNFVPNVGGTSHDISKPQPVPHESKSGEPSPVNYPDPSDSQSDIVETEMTDEELAVAMAKYRRKRLVTGPNLSKEDIKRLRNDPRHKLSSGS